MARPGTAASEAGLSPVGRAAVRRWLEGYVDSGRLPGAQVALARRGRIELFHSHGWRSLESGVPIDRETIFRIHSMTKPVTAVAAMRLIESGQLGLDDPVSRYIPAFGEVTVTRFGGRERIVASSAKTPMTIWHLLTHTSGLTYGEGNDGPVAGLYQRQHTDFNIDDGPLEAVVDRLARILLFEPGTAWNYGVSSDVLGRVIEVASGMPLDRYLGEAVLGPLRMIDTGFRVPPTKLDRVASVYTMGGGGELAPVDTAAELTIPPERYTLSGGGGLFSTAADYLRFAEMLRRGGRLGETRLLRETSVHLMTRNHLQGDLATMAAPSSSDLALEGIGYGFGMSVVVDPGRTAMRTHMGEYGWGGHASTAFFVDPGNEVTAVFMTQLIPSGSYPIRSELRSLVADAL
jgi:CubicO group peptidase (beta-lactamase class C family)